MIGPYPFEKLAGVAAPMMGGAMEHASVVFYGDGGQRDGKPPMANRRGGGDAREPVAFAAYGVMSHEIAHQWFGDSVTEAGWGDVWLSEGFATYFADLYTEHYEGRDAFVKALKSRPHRRHRRRAQGKGPGHHPGGQHRGPGPHPGPVRRRAAGSCTCCASR
jgi:aminopeptidase N